MYSVYVHKNLKNDKYYVGCTKMNPKRRWKNGKGYNKQPKMWKDIQNSDWNKDWVHGILGKFYNKQDALNYEAFLIAMLDTINNGYNSSEYSNYGFTEETKKKLSEAMTGENNPLFGKHHSDETKRKIAESQTGKHPSDETRRKMSESHGVNGILQYSKSGEFIAEFPSIMEAERQTACSAPHICACCKGKCKSCGG